MSDQNGPRDTQFQGFAKALFDRLYDQFSNLFIEYDDGREKEVEQTKKGILETIAEAGYDLANHAAIRACRLTLDGVPFYYGENDAVHGIPDMAELPKEQE